MIDLFTQQFQKPFPRSIMHKKIGLKPFQKRLRVFSFQFS
jgi:hypothetical protein